MRKYLATIAISGILLLLGSIPCYADAGTAMGISAEATVVAGNPGSPSSGSSSCCGSGGRSHSTTPSTPSDNATSTILSDNTTAYVPPVYVPPTYTPPTPEPYIPVEGQPMPAQQSGGNNTTLLLIIGGIVVAGVIFWKFILKRKG